MSYSIWDKQPDLKILPMPFEMAYKMADDQEKRHDRDLEDTYRLQSAIGNIKSASFDRQFKKQLDDEYQPQFEALTQKVINNDPSSRNDLLKLKSKYLTDQRIKTLENNASQEELALKDKAEALKKNSYKHYYDPLDSQGTFLKDRKELTPFVYQGMKEFTHPYDDAAKVVSSIAETQLTKDGYTLDRDSNGQLTGYYTDNKGTKGVINDDKFKNIIKASVPLFLGTNGGQSYLDQLKNEYGINKPEDLQYGIEDYLSKAAYKQLHVLGGGSDLKTLPGYDYKEKNVNPYDEYDETQGIQTENVTGINKNIFDVVPKNTTYYTGKQIYKKDGEAYTTFPEQKVSTKDAYKDLNSLPPEQKVHINNMMEGLSTNPEFTDIYKRFKNNNLTDEDKAKVYPLLKHITEVADTPQIRNAQLINITDKNERKSINSLLGGSNDETITRKQFGAGRYINRKAYDMETGKVLDSRELALKIHNEGSGDDLITIGGKYVGPNPIAITTNNPRFANGVQMSVGGKSYILEGPTSYKDPQLEVQRRKNEIATEVYKSAIIPNVPNHINFFGKDISTVFIPSNGSSDVGEYKIISADGKKLDGTKSYSTAEELTQDLPNIIK